MKLGTLPVVVLLSLCATRGNAQQPERLVEDTWGRPPDGIDAHSPFSDVCVEDGCCGYSIVSDVLLVASLGVGVAATATYGATDGATTGLSAEPLLNFGIANAINLGANFLTKELTARPRPLTYSETYRAARDHPRKSDAVSFYSGHASTTATNTFLAATTFAVYTRGISSSERVFGSLAAYSIAAAWTATVAALRVQGGKHYNSDVIVGGLAGTLLGVLTPLLLHEVWPEQLTADAREPPPQLVVSGAF
jgi:membrane-associated phospholipid phosphatase